METRDGGEIEVGCRPWGDGEIGVGYRREVVER